MAKFKKLALVSSAILMTTAFAFGVAACGEEACAHTYEKKSNETHTWYACTQEGCDSVVGKEEIHVHNYVKKNDETHTWYECDKEGCDSVVAKEEIVTPHVHTFALKSNDTKHWYECTDTECAEKVGEVNHVWNDGEETVAPQVGVAGEYTYTCRVCGKTDVEAIPALQANPLIVAEGSAVGVNYQWKYVTLNLEAGDYVALTDNTAVTCDPFTVTEAGEFEVAFYVFTFDVDGGADVAFNYTIKKVPAITPTEMSGSVEIVTYAWVKVNVTVPVAGKFAIGSEDAYFSDYAGGGEQAYVFTTTEANETVTFYVKAMDEEDEKATVSYEVIQLTAQELAEGTNAVTLWGFTATDVTFTAPATGAYKFATYDESLAFYKVYDDYQLFDTVNDVYYFEAEEGDVVSFSITGWYDVATFAIEEFPDEERYTSIVTFDQEGEGYANLKAGSTATFTLPMAMMMNVGMLTWDNEDVVLSIDNNGSSITATTQQVAFSTPFGVTASIENTAQEDIELTFTLTLLNGMDGFVDSSVEVYVPASGGYAQSAVSLPVILDAGNYFVSVSSSTITSASYNGTALNTTAVEVTATGDETMPDALQILGHTDNAEMVVVTIVKPGTAECPIVVNANGQTFENVALVDVTITMPWGAPATNPGLCFSYTATANGTLAISGVSPYTITPLTDELAIDEAFEMDNGTFEVVAGETYLVCIGQQDPNASPISPVFTFTAAQAE